MISLVVIAAVLIVLVLDRVEKRLDRRDGSRSSHFQAPGS